MKIMNATTPKPAATTASGRAAAKGASAPAAATPASSSSTTASAADPATRLSQLEAQFSQSEFDAAKVSEVTNAIAKGQYKVNAGAVADKLLENAATLNKSGGNR